MALSNYYVTDQDIRTVSTRKGGERFGQLANTADGRTYAYGFNGTGSGTALAPGKLTQGAFATANHVNQTGVTYASGTNQINYSVGATAVTASQYQDGYFYVVAGTGAGQMLLVNNTTTVTSAGGAIKVYLKDALIAATSVTDSKFSLQPNEYSSLVVSATGSALANFPAGVPNVSVPDQNFAWVQIGGPCSTLINGTPGVGVNVVAGGTTAGSVDVESATAANQVAPIVGYMLLTGVTTTYGSVFLTINQS